MTDAAIISGSLVDVRNVGTHKSVKLTIHVPEEHATKVVAAFGWPTGVNPVSVAIARLNGAATDGRFVGSDIADDGAKIAGSPGEGRDGTPAGGVEGSNPSRSTKRSFDEMPPPQQAGMLSQDRAFRLFLAEKFDMPLPDPDEAADVIRHHCKVKSRAHIKPDNVGWSELLLGYQVWKRAAEVVPA